MSNNKLYYIMEQKLKLLELINSKFKNKKQKDNFNKLIETKFTELIDS